MSLKALAALVLARDTGRDSAPAECPTFLAGAAATAGHPASPPAALALSGVPPSWAEGVTLLRTRLAPPGVLAVRWAGFLADAERPLAEHGAELHRLGWDTLDLFGLHRRAPFARCDAMGAAWLLDGRPVAALAAEAVTFTARSGTQLRVWRMGQHAWALTTGAEPRRREMSG